MKNDVATSCLLRGLTCFIKGTSPPAQSSPAALTEAGSSQPNGGSTAPSTPSRQPLQPIIQSTNTTTTTSKTSSAATPLTTASLPLGQAPPPKKRKKLTPAEKKAKEEEDAARKLEVEKKKKEAEAAKAHKEEQKELKRAEKEKAEKLKEEKKKEMERRAREKQEEAERKARAQPKIANFFAKKKEPVAVVKCEPEVKDVVVKARSPSPPAVKTEYEKLAQPFFIHQHVSLAKGVFSMDEETREAKSAILDDHLSGKRSSVSTKPFKAMERLQLVATPRPRGKLYPNVRELMSEQYGLTSATLDQTAESQKLRADKTRQALKGVRVKQLSFHEDVRPGYYGTITSVRSLENLKRLAKNPIARDLPLNYDYDSEAEWVQGDEEPDEEGEDLEDEEDDEEEDDKSIDEFLDDSEDVARIRNPYGMGNMEPEISGICFEDQQNQNPNAEMRKFRMEFLIRKYHLFRKILNAADPLPANFERGGSIDPFSPSYWPSDPEPTTNTASNKAGKAKAIKALGAGINGMAPPSMPSSAGAAVPSKPASAADLVPAADLDDFKAAILEFKFLPKAALLPTLKKKFDRCTSGQIKATLEHVAEKPTKKGDWQIKRSI